MSQEELHKLKMIYLLLFNRNVILTCPIQKLLKVFKSSTGTTVANFINLPTVKFIIYIYNKCSSCAPLTALHTATTNWRSSHECQECSIFALKHPILCEAMYLSCLLFTNQRLSMTPKIKNQRLVIEWSWWPIKGHLHQFTDQDKCHVESLLSVGWNLVELHHAVDTCEFMLQEERPPEGNVHFAQKLGTFTK